MTEPGFDLTAAIAEHSRGFAEAADGNLEASVEHCPGWSVADLVGHLTEVHWFWATIVEERLAEPPDESRRPPRADSERLIGTFRDGAERLVDVLVRAPQDAEVWTWSPQHDVAFVTRHQVQEAAVHHWDAVHAAGGSLRIDPAVAADSIEEFLTFSVSSEADPAEPPRPPLDGEIALACTDIEASWNITDGAIPGTVRSVRGAPAAPAVRATGSDLLSWLYQRVEVPLSAELSDLAARLRALTFTD